LSNARRAVFVERSLNKWLDIIGDKIWIQHDGTSPGVAEELVEAGIPRDAIVLGFHPAYVRQHTGFAVA
jgi:hypothetical protein